MRAQVKTITPEYAQEILAKHNDNNRTISMNAVRYFARLMQEGKWQTNGESIVFDKNGKLKDGQHRLMTIVRSGVPIEMVVIDEVDNAVDVYDVGRKRTDRDILQVKGCSKAVCNLSTLSTILFLAKFYAKDTNLKLSAEEKREIAEKDNCADVIYSWITLGHRKRIGRVAPVYAAMYVAYQNGVDYQKLCTFYRILSTGFYNTEYQTPVIVLRNQILNDQFSNIRSYEKQLPLFYAVQEAIRWFDEEKPRIKPFQTNMNSGYYSIRNAEKMKEFFSV